MPVTADLAHAASEADSIRAHDFRGLALVLERHEPVLACAEFKSPEVYPGSAAPCLVHLEHGAASQMMHGIAGPLATVLVGSIADVNRILPSLRYVRGP